MTKRDILVLFAIIGVAFAARAVSVVALTSPKPLPAGTTDKVEPLRGDARTYFRESVNFLNGRPYTWNRAPGYSMYLAAAQWIAGGQPSVRACQWANVAISVLGVLGVYLCGVVLHGRRLGEIAAAIVALDPRYVSHVIFPMSENAHTPLTIWSLLVAVWALNRPTIWRGGLTGVVMALAALTRSIGLYFIPVAALAMLVYGKRPWRESVLPALAIFAGTAITIAPWTVRNYQVFNRFVLISTDDGTPFLMGNVYSRHDRPTIEAEEIKKAFQRITSDDPHRAWTVERNRGFKQRGIELIIERQFYPKPGNKPTWIFEKIDKFGWRLLIPGGSFLSRGGENPHIFGPWGVIALRWFFIGSQMIVMGLAVFGFARHTRTGADVVLILYVLYLFSVHLVTYFGPIRFQMPYLWIFALYAGRAFVDRPRWNWRRVVTLIVLWAVVGLSWNAYFQRRQAPVYREGSGPVQRLDEQGAPTKGAAARELRRLRAAMPDSTTEKSRKKREDSGDSSKRKKGRNRDRDKRVPTGAPRN